MLQNIVHYSLHFLIIGIIAWFYDPANWKRNYLVLLSTMLVDLDHLLADPIFHPGRCSIGFHYLHSEYIVPFYLVGAALIKKSVWKLIFIGLSFHMLTDFIDCIWMYSACSTCHWSQIFTGI